MVKSRLWSKTGLGSMWFLKLISSSALGTLLNLSKPHLKGRLNLMIWMKHMTQCVHPMKKTSFRFAAMLIRVYLAWRKSFSFSEKSPKNYHAILILFCLAKRWPKETSAIYVQCILRVENQTSPGTGTRCHGSYW